MTRPNAAAVARTAVAVAAALTVVATVLAVGYRRDPAGLGLAALVLLFLSVPLVGAAVVRGEPGNPVGWTLLACGVSVPLAVGAFVYSHARYTPLAGWLDGWPWTPALTLVPVLGVLLFPDGRLPSRRWRPVLWLALAVLAAQLLNELFAPHLLDHPQRANPTALPGPAGAVADALGASIVLVPPLATLNAWAVQRRPRTPALRLLTPAAWLIAASWWACGVAVVATGDSNDALGAELSGLVVLAVTAWLAIRRHGLYDVRKVVNRALVYTGLSLAVLAVYLAVAAGARALGAPVLSGPVAAVATLLAALPLREALQRLANRISYGDRDDPYAALVRLGHRLEDAAAADEVLPGVARTVREALRLPYVAIDLGPARVDSGTPTVCDEYPLTFAGETIGALRAGRREPDQPFTPAEARLLAGLAGQVAAAGHAVSLTRDLRRSRERLVSATEEERRRIRRDLHDGLGPGLAGVVLGLRRARRDIATDPAAVADRLDALTEQVQLAVGEVRRLVYGLRPPALDELGLVGALREQGLGLGDFDVAGPPGALALPAAVEVAAYRIALEAMTNVARHAGAGRASVRITLDGALTVEVADEGVGLPDGYRAGVGIASMRERAAELGGDCTVTAAGPHGTVVRACLPLEPS
ncbi:histidine kinase [Dactylosporangium sp. NPDC049140]|uniref:histidine kinase n=1 Tax=Dactylosporangium sp. NPDC049140 TaxID=3155647 RepID=UPI0033D7FAE7